ncbi:MAG TPA: cytochrome c [Rhizomicrobium sp.]|nr:cytochrome c [Rhizomicrobium sp.]
MRTPLAAAAAIISVAAVAGARADTAQDMGAGAMNRSPPYNFQGGEAVFKNICQGCHMANAQGAVGAGAYPALARNAKLEVAGYPVAVIVHGQKAMPAFGGLLNDQQIADVVNYVRTHFGNNYKDKVTPADVKAQR